MRTRLCVTLWWHYRGSSGGNDMENNGELQADFRFSLFEYFYSCDRGGGGGEEERTRQHHHPPP